MRTQARPTARALSSCALSPLSCSLLFALFALGCEGVAACPEGSEPLGGRCVTRVDGGPRADVGSADAGPPIEFLDASVWVDASAPVGADAAAPFSDDAAAPSVDAAPNVDAASCALRTLHRDQDGDGRGDPTMPMTGCGEPEGWVLDATDCDDACASCFPGAEESCDGVDQDCDALVDEEVQRGYFRDADGDGRGLLDEYVFACALPDGYAIVAGDCDDTRASVRPGAPEVCNGLDDDCDHRVDQTFACAAGASVSCTTTCGTRGTALCVRCEVPGPSACTPPVESCNGLDEDCDGWIDEGVRTFGSAVSAGAAGRRIEVLPYAGGFVAVFQNESGVRAQRFDASGARVGSEASLYTGATPDFGAAVWGDVLYLVIKESSDLAGLRFDLTPVIARISAPVSLGAGDVSQTNRIRLVVPSGNPMVVFPARITPTGSARAVYVLTRSAELTGTSPRFTAFSLATTSDDLDVVASSTEVFVASVFASGATSQLNVSRIPYGATSGGGVRSVTIPTGGAVPRLPQLAVEPGSDGRSTLAVLYQREGAASLRLASVQVGADGSLDASAPDAAVASVTLPSSGPAHPSDVVSLGTGRFGLGYLEPAAGGATVRYFEANVPALGAPTLHAVDGIGASPAASGSLSLSRSLEASGAVMLGLSPAGISTARTYTRACR